MVFVNYTLNDGYWFLKYTGLTHQYNHEYKNQNF